ncbi:MAG: DCC1-like thiol-disulfide oxidoreductase family protein [Thermoanaerobaculia bacterium]
MALLRRLDIRKRIAFRDALRDWPRIQREFPALTQEQCLESMHVATPRGRIHSGFDAYRALAWALPLAWPVAPFLYVPGVPWVGRRVYAAVAARRRRLGCPVAPGTTPAVSGPGSGTIGADDRT